MATRYPTVISGEGFELRPVGRSKSRFEILKLACCDCGLIHRIGFAIEKNGNLGIALERDNRATAAHRRNAKFRRKKRRAKK